MKDATPLHVPFQGMNVCTYICTYSTFCMYVHGRLGYNKLPFSEHMHEN